MTHPFIQGHAQNTHAKADFQAHRKAMPKTRVGILGGGTAGATIAIRLAALGIYTTVFEKKSSLIDGPPMCHLHAGGNLYREIPDEDCIELLKQCIDILRLYPYTIDVRPTVFAVPTRDDDSPDDLLPRLDKLTQVYKELIKQDSNNQVLGEPDDYYQLFSYEQMVVLSKRQQVTEPKTLEQWMIPVAKHLDLNKVKYPLIVAQEYGWNIFRLSASAQLALAQYEHATILTNTYVKQVTKVIPDGNAKNQAIKWNIEYQRDQSHSSETIEVDYLINACGFQIGEIDDMVGVDTKRMVEFKASYISHWQGAGGQMPEIIIYGNRGTPQGMAQLTPYPNGYYQIHGMTNAITLFNDGLVETPANSAQPKLPHKYINYISEGWDKAALQARSQKAIDYVAEFVPAFKSANIQNNVLFGGQQIPGEDDTLRVADVSLYSHLSYARAENVKASSTLTAADEIVAEFTQLGLVGSESDINHHRVNHQWPYLKQSNNEDITQMAQVLAKERGFPVAMAGINNSLNLSESF
ncbi:MULTISPECIES: FAD-dependent oxidoreductase [unclassified Pseudoalteromonas]|uniref:FAD-dependent oxidoreductase n=1 Tax=unclassified Pseudoalteromonas TaxID=194690 RepID=UPI000B3C860B|nr:MULTISPECIES: FAD-dependent oxidoreductase [unclassified Pseudoalteromonas]MDN3377444.1 FAD-dependent oxidoreductase [Pseudoalteromonas sp. APC 3893]MDN3385389.1 FAD-dependent oxidoreductase [Pseudoalteromonas sp. APC 4017]OUS72332.1 FAD-dependent oxidoreductase [Pseudoalteromonas sp. A601]